jgi:AcrR family transcriptional regulator
MPAKKKQISRKYHHGDLRKAIMDAALDITATSGLEGLSLREVARKIGVTTAAPYHHFQDRQALLLDLAIDAYGKLREVLEQAKTSARDADAEVAAAATAYYRFGRQHRAEYAIMFAGEFTTHARFGEMMSVANACLDLVRTSIADASRLGEKETAEAAFCAWSLLHGILQLDQKGVLLETEEEQERLAVQGVVAIVSGFASRTPSSK